MTPEARENDAVFIDSNVKAKENQVTPQTVARVEYDKVFGDGTYYNLQKTSTLMPAHNMELTVDCFLSLHAEPYGLNVAKIESLVDPAKREELFINIPVDVANKVYAAVPEASRPARMSPEQIARCFMTNLVHPARHWNLLGLVETQPALQSGLSDAPQELLLDLTIFVSEQLKVYGRTKENTK